MQTVDTPVYGTAEQCYPEYGWALFVEHLQRYEYVKDFAHNKIILDFGCGEGYGTAILKKVGKIVVGSDRSKAALCRARKKYGADVKFVVSDCLQGCFKKNIFDIIVSFEVIEHMKDIDAYLRAICKMLKADGVFYLSTPNRSVQEKLRKKIDRTKFSFHLRELSAKELKEYLRKYFKEVKLAGQVKKHKHRLYNFIKMIDWFNLRHVILPRKATEKLIDRFYYEGTKDNIGGNFIITDRIIRQAPILIAICKKPINDIDARTIPS